MRQAERDAAFSDFVASRQAHLRRVAYALCGDWHTADDLVQTALVKLYVAWPRVERRGTEEAYVRQILVRSNIDRFRKPSRREQPQDALPEQPGPDDMAAQEFYRPAPRGLEISIGDRLAELRRLNDEATRAKKK